MSAHPKLFAVGLVALGSGFLSTPGNQLGVYFFTALRVFVTGLTNVSFNSSTRLSAGPLAISTSYPILKHSPMTYGKTFYTNIRIVVAIQSVKNSGRLMKVVRQLPNASHV